MAANRRGPTSALDPGITAVQAGDKTDEEFVAIWANIGGVLANVAGSNTITATAPVTIASYTNGLEFEIVPAAANVAGGVTINVDTVGAVDVRDASGAVLAANAFVAAKAYSIRYRSTDGYFRIVSGSGGQVAYESKAATFALTQISGTSAGDATSGAYRTYPLNATIANDLVGEGCSLDTATNKITALPAGTYDVTAFASFFQTGKARLRLFNVTDGAEISLGKTTPVADTGDSSIVTAGMSGRFVIASAKDVRVEYRVTTTNNVDGLGANAAFGDTEVYGFVAFRRVPGVVDPGSGWGRRTLWIPAGTHMIANTTNGPASGTVESTTNKVMMKTLDYDASTIESAQFLWVPPKSWDLSTIACRFVWKHAATSTNFGVRWGIAAVAISDDDTMDVAFGTEILVTDTGGTTVDLYRSAETAAVTIAGTPAAGDAVALRFRRVATDGADTMTIDAGLLGVEIYYNINANSDL